MDAQQITPQIIKTPSGEDMVVLSRRDYDAIMEALVEAQEDLADIATLDERLAEIAARPDVPLVNAEVSRLILQGHKRVAAIRLWRGLSVEALAAMSKVSAIAIAEMEAGTRLQTMTEAEALAKAMDVNVAWLEP